MTADADPIRQSDPGSHRRDHWRPSFQTHLSDLEPDHLELSDCDDRLGMFRSRTSLATSRHDALVNRSMAATSSRR